MLTSPVPSHSLAQLVARTGLSLGTVTRTVIALEARGWLQAASLRRYEMAPLGLLWSAERSEIRDAETAVAGWVVTAGEPSAQPSGVGAMTRFLVEVCVGPMPFLTALRYREELLDALAELPPLDRWEQVVTAIPLRWHQFDNTSRRCRFGRHVLMLHRDDSGGYLECVRCGAFQNLLFHTTN